MSEPKTLRAERLTVDRPTFSGREFISNHILSGVGCAKYEIAVVDGTLTVQQVIPDPAGALADPGNGVPAGLVNTATPAPYPGTGVPNKAGTPATVDPADFWTLPENALVTRAIVKVNTAFVGGTSIEVGNLTDPDGFFTALTAALTAGSTIVGSGALLDNLVGTDPTNDLVVKATATGSFTAGSATLTLVWIDPS